ncbi:MAG: VOC family protein [Candidatus Promineifilaceae bacterium]|jgi:predicted enzyme related to lactoylglutathione lyase
MKRPVHFEILADDPVKVGEFYSAVFDWEINTWGEGEQTYWLVTTGPDDAPGINGGIMGREFKQAVINTLEVESLEETTKKIEEAGGQIILGPNEISGTGTHAYFADIEGNLFGVMQPYPAE